MTIEDNTHAVVKAIERRLAVGLEAAVAKAAEGYRERVTAEQSPPPSDPGEFPHEDTGQGAENIAYGVGTGSEGMEGRFGVFGADSPIPQFPGQDHVGGEHLDWLRSRQGRLGMDESFAQDLDAVRNAFAKGVRRR